MLVGQLPKDTITIYRIDQDPIEVRNESLDRM